MTLERTQTISCRNTYYTYTPSHIVPLRILRSFYFYGYGDIALQDSSSSFPLSLSSSSLTRPTRPAPLFSLSTFPASESLDANAFRAPAFVPTSQICSLAFDPAAAIVRGSSGEKTAENTLPYRRCEMVREQRRKGNFTYNVEIPRCDHAHRWLTALGLIHVPNLHDLVRAASHDASAQQRTHIQRGRCTVVRRNREPRGRRRLEVRRQRPRVEIEHETIFERDLYPHE